MIKTTTKKIEHKGEMYFIDERMPEDFAKALIDNGAPLRTNHKEEMAHLINDTMKLTALSFLMICCFFLPSIIGGMF